MFLIVLIDYYFHLWNKYTSIRFIFKEIYSYIKKFCLYVLFCIDANTALRLELVLNSSFNTKNTLYDVLNRCITVGGQRRLRSSILQPSSDIQLIHNRQEAVEEILRNREQDITQLRVFITLLIYFYQ